MWSEMVYWGTSGVTDQSEENQVVVNADTTDNFYLREHSNAHNNGSNTGFGPVCSQNFGTNVHVIHGVISSEDLQDRRNLKHEIEIQESDSQGNHAQCIIRNRSGETAVTRHDSKDLEIAVGQEPWFARACSPDTKPANCRKLRQMLERPLSVAKGFFQPPRLVNSGALCAINSDCAWMCGFPEGMWFAKAGREW